MARIGQGPTKRMQLDVEALFRKLSWRLLPLFWTMVVLNYIDRTNLAFAAIQLNRDLGFTPQVYGLGSGLFFSTYATLQIPSNILLRRVGGPSWLACIIAAWGAVAVSFSLMKTKAQFFILRALLGVAEAGAFPGMWFMLNRFYPPGRITVAFAVVESGIALSHTLAGPLAAALLTMDGLWGLRGWQWLFFLEGLPSLALAAAMLYLLPASPETMSSLSVEERTYLTAKLSGARTVDDDDEESAGGGGDSETSALLSSGSSSLSKATETSRLMTGTGAGSGTNSGTVINPVLKVVDSAGSRSGKAAESGAGGRWTRWLPADVRVAVSTSVQNKYVWYLGGVKVLRDVAGFGVIFFSPMIVQALVNGHSLDVSALGLSHAKPMTVKATRLQSTELGVHKGRSLLSEAELVAEQLQQLGSSYLSQYLIPSGSGEGQEGWAVDSQWRQLGGRQLLGGVVGSHPPPTGVKAALLTSVPFGLAALATLFVAHRSQVSGERILHIGLPAVFCGAVFTALPFVARHSVVAAFLCLCCGVIGVNSIAAPSLALLSELAQGPGLVVSLPMYNSLGNIGGFVGPFIIGTMLSQTNSFALPCMLMGVCLASSGLIVLIMPHLLGMPSGVTGAGKHRK